MSRSTLDKIADALAASVVDSFEDFQLTVENFVSMEQTGSFTVSLGYLAGQGRRMNVWAMNIG
jgi:hypothetical protein